MHKLLVTTAILAAIGASPAHAVLTVSIQSGGVNFTCADGQACDLAGPSSTVLILDETINGVNVEGTFSTSMIHPDTLTLSNLTITDVSGAPRSITLAASDTGFAAPVTFVSTSASATFTDNIGGTGSLQFFADTLNRQGAGNPIATPGDLLFTVNGLATVNPQSFAGTRTDSFIADAPFSMTETATFTLRNGGSITGFDSSAVSGVPEPKTWALLGIGFALMGLMGFRRQRTARFLQLS